MHLYCTKKLLSELGVTPERPEVPADPLFQWTAHLITLNRRKAVVVVHAASRCMFLIYGLTAKIRPQLPALLLEGVRTLLQSEYVRPEIVRQYLADCGEAVTFGPNPSRSIVSACNQACERVRFFAGVLDPDDRFQQRLLPWLNSDLVARANYAFSYAALLQGLRERYGPDVQDCRSFELEATLELETPCRRTLVVPGNLNLYQLHRCLQVAFDWTDSHLHQFILEEDRMGRPLRTAEPACMLMDDFPLDGQPPEDSLALTVEEVFTAYPSILYEYDFGDGWTHIIRCKGIQEHCSQPYPRCTDLVGDAPMEDCGGPGGFADILRILNDPTDPEYREVKAWVEASRWYPADQRKIDLRLRDAWRSSIPVVWD